MKTTRIILGAVLAALLFPAQAQFWRDPSAVSSNGVSTVAIKVPSVVLDNTNQDVVLVRDAAGILAQRNSTNKQTLNVYQTYTDAANYTRFTIDTSSGSHVIATENAGTGPAAVLFLFNRSASGIVFGTSNTSRWQIDSNGHLIGSTDNTYDIGAGGATRPRTLYVATSVLVPTIDTESSVKLTVGATSTGVNTKGTNTNDSAAAGYVGEYISSTVASASAVALSTTVSANLTSISLTAGDWDVECQAIHKFAATTTTTLMQLAISTTSATLPTATAGATDYDVMRQASSAPGGDTGQHVGAHRLSLSATTTVYCVANDTFATSTAAIYGTLRARRVR